jgi:hypothetical protein
MIWPVMESLCGLGASVVMLLLVTSEAQRVLGRSGIVPINPTHGEARSP